MTKLNVKLILSLKLLTHHNYHASYKGLELYMRSQKFSLITSK